MQRNDTYLIMHKGMGKASTGVIINLCYYDNHGQLLNVRSIKVGENGIKPDVFYKLDASGRVVECENQYRPA